jgi:hypothetical protein
MSDVDLVEVLFQRICCNHARLVQSTIESRKPIEKKYFERIVYYQEMVLLQISSAAAGIELGWTEIRNASVQ